MLLATAIILLAPSVQESDADRLRTLEERVRQQDETLKRQQEEIDRSKQERQGQKTKAGPEDSKGPGLQVVLKDGITFQTDDGSFEMTLGAHVGVHYRFVADRPDDPTRTSPDTFFIRQARPEISGVIYNQFEFRFMADFPTGTTSTVTGTLLDAYFGWKPWPELSLRIGQMKVPVGQERSVPDRVVEMDERSVLDRLVFDRDIGILLYGRFADGLFSYETGAFNGQGRAVPDANDEKEIAVRLRSRPFVADGEGSVLGTLRIGLAGTVGDVDDGSINGLDFTTTELSYLFLDSTAGVLDGRRTRLNAEFAWAPGPFTIRAEVIRRTDEVDIAGKDGARIRSLGWVAQAHVVLTGERRPLDGRPTPGAPFHPATGAWGAVELGFRVAHLEVEDDIFTLGIASPAVNARKVTAYTLGLNWFLAKNVRVAPNFIVENYDRRIVFANGAEEDRAIGGILRFQIDF